MKGFHVESIALDARQIILGGVPAPEDILAVDVHPTAQLREESKDRVKVEMEDTRGVRQVGKGISKISSEGNTFPHRISSRYPSKDPAELDSR